MTEEEDSAVAVKEVKKQKAAKVEKPLWPKQQAARTKAVQDAIAARSKPATAEELAADFRGKADQIPARAEQISDILGALCSLGLARKSRGKYAR